MRFGDEELAYLETLGFASPFLEYLAGFRFSGDMDAIPEGTIVFAGEPLVRVTGPRIEAQLLETLLLNQLNFQTADGDQGRAHRARDRRRACRIATAG